ncbi:MAG: DUF3592 domain-containing protein [Clostridia bacterium]|nr:DUF3592 domain-containing protein [Clostridia bacterium]
MLSVLRDNLTSIVFASLPGLVFIGLGIYEIITRRRKQRQETVRAVGKVLYIEAHESRSGKYRNVVRVHDSPVVQFSVDGTTVQHKSDIEYRENTFLVGETVTLFYDPSDPSHFHLEKRFRHDRHAGTALIAAGLAWAVLSSAIIIIPKIW